MNIAKIHLNNGEIITINANDIVYGISTVLFESSRNMSNAELENNQLLPRAATLSRPITLYSHHHAGLIPVLVELFNNYSFFQFEENATVSYSCSSVTKIELLDDIDS